MAITNSIDEGLVSPAGASRVGPQGVENNKANPEERTDNGGDPNKLDKLDTMVVEE